MPLLRIFQSLRRQSDGDQTGEKAASEGPKSRSVLASKPKRGILRRDAHGALRRLVKPLSASSVLEISVGDGSTAVAVLETLAKRNPGSIQYAAIDEFELSGGPITLREFHRRLRQLNVRPRLFPDKIERGLLRVANTIGAVDLVLIGATVENWQTPATLQLLQRITHKTSVVLQFDGDQWSRYAGPPATRSAA